MPWKECSVVEERMRFVVRLLEGEQMSSVCRSFGISRKTGYKIFERYKHAGLESLQDQSRRPCRFANKLPVQVETVILSLKRDKPHWGARKLRELLARRFPLDGRIPAVSTIHAVLDRHGLVEPMRPRTRRAQGTPLSSGAHPNDVWCADYKGEFMLGNKRYCYPLTVTDQASRYLLLCEAMESVKEELTLTAFERLFKERGLPTAIRTDNGVPFASPRAIFGLSRLSVWWLRLGIELERIKPGRPQQNGRHERMHRTLKQETARPAQTNFLRQQEAFDRFLDEFNRERPHEGLQMKMPVEIYTASARPYQGPGELVYPFHDRTVRVMACGRIFLNGTQINVSQVFAGQTLGVKEVDDGVWLLSFMDYDLGYVDLEAQRLQPLPNPFEARKV